MAGIPTTVNFFPGAAPMFSGLHFNECVPFADLSPLAIAAVFAIYVFGFFIRGVFGFGSNILIVLLTTWLMSPHHAILLVALTSTGVQAQLLPQGIRHGDWRIAKLLMVAIVVGIALGTWLFAALDAGWFTLVLGAALGAIVLMQQYKVVDRLAKIIDLRSSFVASLLAAVAGVISTVAGGGGIYFLATYLRAVCPTPQSLRATNILVGGLLIFLRLAFFLAAGFISTIEVVEALLLLPAVFVGTYAGTHYFQRLPLEQFYRGFQLLLLGASVALVVKGVNKVT